LILGEKDPALQPDKIRKAFSNMEWHGDIHEIKGAGHDVVRPSVDETVRVINQFWAKLEFCNGKALTLRKGWQYAGCNKKTQ
jgi:hypothetical protein